MDSERSQLHGDGYYILPSRELVGTAPSYIKGLKSSDCYKNLNLAKDKLDTLLTYLKNLKAAYNNSSGTYVVNAVKSIKSLISIVESYYSKINLVIDGLTKNAESFDRCLNKWLNKDYSKGYPTNGNVGYGEHWYSGTRIYINTAGYIEAYSYYGTNRDRNVLQWGLNIISFGFAYPTIADEYYDYEWSTPPEMLNS